MDQSFFVHPSSCIDEPCSIGRRTQIWHFCHVMKDAVIGEDCRIGQNVFIASGVQIGNNVKIQNNVSVYAGVILEDDVFCGPSIVFTNVLTPRSAFPRQDSYTQTLVRRGATIGANATILCGITVGEHAMIGAGAVVTRDVPPYAIVYGNPGRLQGYACECGVVLTPGHSPDSVRGKNALTPGPSPGGRGEILSCGECGRRYRETAEGIEREG